MKFSIKWALIGGIIGLQVISVSIILASSYLTSQEVLLQHAKDIMGNIAEFTIHEAENYLKPAHDAATLTQRLADSEVVGTRNRDTLQSYFYEQLSLQANFAGIYLGLPNGEFIYVNRTNAKVENGFRTKIISQTDAGKVTELIWKDAAHREITREYDPHDVYDPTQRPWYMDARRKRETIWTEPYIFFTSQQPGLTTASPVFDAAGELAGVVGVDIEIDKISFFLSRLKIGKNGRAFILDRKGDVVAYPDVSRVKWATGKDSQPFRLRNIDELDDILCRKAFASLQLPAGRFDIQTPVFGSFPHEGRNYHTMFAPFANPLYPWIIGIYLPEDDYLGPIKQNRQFNIYVMLVIASVGSLIGFFIVRGIARPMKAFQSEAQAIKRYDLETTFDKHSVIKEIQETADSFAQMKAGLKDFKQKNAELTRGLNERAEELRLKELHLRATFVSLVNFSDALILLDGGHAMRFMNPRAESLLGVRADDVLGQPFMFPLSAEKTTEIRIAGPSDEPVIAEMHVVETEWEGQPAYLAALRDVTERKHMEAEIRWRAETLAALHEAALELSAQDTQADLLRVIAARAVRFLESKGVAIFLHRPDQDSPEAVFCSSPAWELSAALVARKAGIAAKVFETGQPQIVDDCHQGGQPAPTGDAGDFRACLAVPISWGKRVIGVLMVGDAVSRKYTLGDIVLLEGYTPLAAAALEQKRLLAEAETHYAQARRDSETKSVLLQEVNHRVKNNLSAILGLLYAERRHAAANQDPRFQTSMEDLSNRIQGLAAVHTLLSASEWRPLLLAELAEKITLATLQALPPHKSVSVAVLPAEIRVTPGQANSLAMVINEMATNTVKYALAGRKSGAISVEISMEEPKGRVRLVYRDDGPGYPEEVLKLHRYNLGLYLMQNIVTQDLHGELNVYNDSGAVTAVRFTPDADTGKGQDG